MNELKTYDYRNWHSSPSDSFDQLIQRWSQVQFLQDGYQIYYCLCKCFSDASCLNTTRDGHARSVLNIARNNVRVVRNNVRVVRNNVHVVRDRPKNV